MNWYVLLTFRNGDTERMYCTSRAEARERRQFYVKSNADVVTATVRKVK